MKHPCSSKPLLHVALLVFALVSHGRQKVQGSEAAPGGGLLSPVDAARGAVMPEGFRMSVFASEPDVVQPVAMTIDDRGRVWVVEMLTYADLKTNFDLTLHDRII